MTIIEAKVILLKLLKSDFENEVNYIEFGAVNSSAKFISAGKSCRTPWRLSAVLKLDIKGKNILVVIADNSPNDRIYPQMADFTFYGGIYRDVTYLFPSAFDLRLLRQSELNYPDKGENAERNCCILQAMLNLVS